MARFCYAHSNSKATPMAPSYKFVTRFGRSLAAVAAVMLTALPAPAEETEPLELFNQRIVPIFRSKDPSSCVQCHLSSVDLKNYILPSSDATFVSLRDQGLIDLANPGKSKILTLIRMGEKDLDEGAKLIHEKMRNAEVKAFSAWIEACCSSPRIRDLPASTKLAGPELPDEVIRHARKSRVVDSFVRNIWSQRMRCFPCHTPHEIDPANPRHKGAVKTHKEFREKYDDAMLDRLEIFRETPEQTLKYLIASSRATPDDRRPLASDRSRQSDAKSVVAKAALEASPKEGGRHLRKADLSPACLAHGRAEAASQRPDLQVNRRLDRRLRARRGRKVQIRRSASQRQLVSVATHRSRAGRAGIVARWRSRAVVRA
ncbi:MAG: hypothetical protein CMJ48_11610 [Planctomycetaceae bacterium]|nr:hypothetical protein [Planctomycetaceae bacterium]